VTGSGPDPIDDRPPAADPLPMITAIRPSERMTARQPATLGERPGRFGASGRADGAAPRERLPRPAAPAYVVDPAAVAAAMVDRLLAGRALSVRAGR
jgi:hypothetical protein